SKVDTPNINPTFPDLKYQRLFPTRLSLDHWLLHERVSVTARNEIDPINLSGQLYVTDLSLFRIRIVTKMGKRNHERAAFSFAQNLYRLFCTEDRIFISNTREICGCYQCHRTDTQTKNADSYSSYSLHYVTLNSILEWCSLEIVISRDEI